MSNLTILPKTHDFLDANDPSCCFRINIDVLNAVFGIKRRMYARACYPDKKDTYFAGTNPNDKYFIWLPKLFKNTSEWVNQVIDDGRLIYEGPEPTRHEDWITGAEMEPGSPMRLVFAKESQKAPYKFMGVYRNVRMNFCDHAYERIATKVHLIGNPVSKIELLDDCR